MFMNIVRLKRHGVFCLTFFMLACLLAGCGQGISPNSSSKNRLKAPDGFTWTINANGAQISLGETKEKIEKALGEISTSNPTVLEVRNDGGYSSSAYGDESGDPFKTDFKDTSRYTITYKYETAGGFEIAYNRFGEAMAFITEKSAGIDFLGLSTGKSRIEDVYSTLVSVYGEASVGKWPFDRYRYTIYFDTNGVPLDFDTHGSSEAALMMDVSFYDGVILSDVVFSWSEGEASGFGLTSVKDFTWEVGSDGGEISLGQTKEMIEEALDEKQERSYFIEDSARKYQESYKYTVAGELSIGYNEKGEAVFFNTEAANITDFLGLSIGSHSDKVFNALVEKFGEGYVYDRNKSYYVFLDTNGIPIKETNTSRAFELAWICDAQNMLYHMKITWIEGAIREK